MRAVTDFGVSTANADNTSQMQAAINWAMTNYARIWLPFNVQIAGTLTINAALGRGGFAIDGPGQIVETSSNLPIINFDGTLNFQEAPQISNLPLAYSTPQGAANTNSYCILFSGTGANSVYNGKFNNVECTYAYRGFGQTGNENLWGNRWTNIRCKQVAGMCLSFNNTNTGGQPNNYFGNVYAINSSCADPYQFAFANQSTLTLDNLEVNQITGCRLLSVSGGTQRGISVRTIRCEVCNVGQESSGTGMIEADGAGIHIEGYEIETLTVNMTPGSNFFLFQDNGASGPPDVVTNAHYFQYTTPGTGGNIYGVNSPNVTVYLQPFYNWEGSSTYTGDVAPGANVTMIWN